MKRKGRKPEIPDFSPKRQPAPGPGTPAAPRGPGAPPPTPNRVIKPHSTSSKSGRRGS
jgi:hypothetical protein